LFDFGGDHGADASESHLACVFILATGDHVSGGQVGTLGHNNQCKTFSVAFAVEDFVADIFERPGDFRDEDHVTSAGDARVKGDPAGVSAHHLQHHDPLVAGGRGM